MLHAEVGDGRHHISKKLLNPFLVEKVKQNFKEAFLEKALDYVVVGVLCEIANQFDKESSDFIAIIFVDRVG